MHHDTHTPRATLLLKPRSVWTPKTCHGAELTGPDRTHNVVLAGQLRVQLSWPLRQGCGLGRGLSLLLTFPLFPTGSLATASFLFFFFLFGSLEQVCQSSVIVRFNIHTHTHTRARMCTHTNTKWKKKYFPFWGHWVEVVPMVLN